MVRPLFIPAFWPRPHPFQVQIVPVRDISQLVWLLYVAVTSLKFPRTAMIEDKDGCPSVNFAEMQYAPEVFDAVLYGLGGMTPVAFLQTAGVQLDLKGEPVTDAAHESSVPKLYIIGDLIGHGHGGGSIISGFNSASRAVRHLLERYLKWPLPPGNGFARPSAQLAFLIWAHTTIV